jgi:heme O synthase-like polyprenyltransferase
MSGDAIAVAALTLRVSDVIALAKPGLNALVVAITAVSYRLGARNGVDVRVLLATIGTALVAGGCPYRKVGTACRD